MSFKVRENAMENLKKEIDTIFFFNVLFYFFIVVYSIGWQNGVIIEYLDACRSIARDLEFILIGYIYGWAVEVVYQFWGMFYLTLVPIIVLTSILMILNSVFVFEPQSRKS